jgi:hypothetical protein
MEQKVKFNIKRKKDYQTYYAYANGKIYKGAVGKMGGQKKYWRYTLIDSIKGVDMNNPCTIHEGEYVPEGAFHSKSKSFKTAKEAYESIEKRLTESN